MTWALWQGAVATVDNAVLAIDGGPSIRVDITDPATGFIDYYFDEALPADNYALSFDFLGSPGQEILIEMLSGTTVVESWQATLSEIWRRQEFFFTAAAPVDDAVIRIWSEESLWLDWAQLEIDQVTSRIATGDEPATRAADIPSPDIIYIDPADIRGGTFSPRAEDLGNSPTVVAVSLRISSESVEQWPGYTVEAVLPGVDQGDVQALRSDVDMPGLRRTSEGLRKADMRLRRLAHPGRYPWQQFDSGAFLQVGKVVRLPDTRGMSDTHVRILSVEKIAAMAVYQITAEHYSAENYPDDYIPGDTAPAPEGLRLLYYGDDPGAGWEWFDDANGRLIYGAGEDREPGELFGSVDYTVEGVTSSVPSHSTAAGAFNRTKWQTGSGSSVYYSSYNASAGGHSHNYLSEKTFTPLFRQERWIEKVGGPGEVPAGAGVLADGPLIAPAYQPVTSNLGRFLRAGGTRGNGGTSLAFSSPLGIIGVGDHSHLVGPFFPATTISSQTFVEYNAGASGAHNHAGNFSFAVNLPRRRLVPYLVSVGGLIVPGAIGGFPEDAPLPPGWYDADGENGTTDMRGVWLELSSVSDAGQMIAGNRTVSWSGVSTLGGQHSHQGSAFAVQHGVVHDAAHLEGQAHTHTASGSTPYEPPSYAMRFIQYTGVVE